MIDLDRLERDAGALGEHFASAQPFRSLVIDDFADPAGLRGVVGELPDPASGALQRSRDSVFARNKFEKSGWQDLGPSCRELHDELTSDRFARWLGTLAGDSSLFVDPAFHGGGVHQAGDGAFLDPHVDFNCHPLHHDWIRTLNVLVYLNEGWDPSWRGELELRHRATGETAAIAPTFNRCVVMETTDFTLHGFRPIAFPSGTPRRSVACYAYSLASEPVAYRSTIWFPEHGLAKRVLGRSWPYLVGAKTRLFGSRTARNR